MGWQREHRVFCVETYMKCGSIIETQRKFKTYFKIKRGVSAPDGKSIKRWIENIRECEQIRKPKTGGRQRSVHTLENITKVKHHVKENPNLSLRKRALYLEINRESLRRIMKNDLKMHPYKLAMVNKLNPNDLETRKEQCQRMLQINPSSTIFFSDEAHFHLCGTVNKQNFRYWSMENPHQLHQAPLHSPKVTVWCAVSEDRIWGPYFFEDSDGRTVTVNTERYCNMIKDFVQPKVEELENIDNVYFMQDGATCHTSRQSMAVLREMFPGKLISLRGDIGWPPRSPDLNPCDFWLWGALKERVFATQHENLDDLKNTIRQEIQTIHQATLRKVRDSFENRLRICAASNGAHMSEIIFKT